MMWKPTHPGKLMFHGVETTASSSVSPISATAALACSQHSRAKLSMSFFVLNPAATVSSADSSAVMAPFAIPLAMSRTTVPETCATSWAGVRIPFTGWV